MLIPKYSEVVAETKAKAGVIQYSPNGIEIARYASSYDAAKQIGKDGGSSRIRRCCMHEQELYAGYRWKFVNEDYASEDRSKGRPNRKVNVYDLKQNFIRQFDDAHIASLELGLDESSLRKVCRRQLLRAGDYTFRYADDCDDIVAGKPIENIHYRKVVMLDSDGKYLMSFKNSMEAKKYFNITTKTNVINTVCSGRHTYMGKIFYYEDDYNKLINNKNMEVA